MKISKTVLDNISSDNSINLMRTTSKSTIKDLREVYNLVNGDENGLVLAVYGSLARFEMLPLSDMDILIFAENEQIIPKTKELIEKLNFDFLDFPSEDFLNLDNIKKFADSNSPDGHAVALYIVAGLPNSRIYKELISARDMGNQPELMLENLIYNYNYINYTVKRKKNPLGANLKYSYGGSRDMIYFDWAGDFLTESKNTELAQTNEVPQIIYSIPTILDFIEKPSEQHTLLSSINFINSIKNQALLLKTQGGHFDGLMSEKTAIELLRNYNYNICDEKELIKIHELTRKIIHYHKKLIYNKIVENLKSNIYNTENYQRLLYMVNLWENPNCQEKDIIIEKLLTNGRWADIVSVICQENARPQDIDYAVDIALNNNAFSHLFRVAIHHPNTTNKTLKKILSNDQIAGSAELEKRYQDVLSKRMGRKL